MAEMRIRCPECEVVLKLANVPEGQTSVKCPKCGAKAPIKPIAAKPKAKPEPQEEEPEEEEERPKPEPKLKSKKGKSKLKKSSRSSGSNAGLFIGIGLAVVVALGAVGALVILPKLGKKGIPGAEPAHFFRDGYQMAAMVKPNDLLNAPLIKSLPDTIRTEMTKSIEEASKSAPVPFNNVSELFLLSFSQNKNLAVITFQEATDAKKLSLPEIPLETYKRVDVHRMKTPEGQQPIFGFLAHNKLIVMSDGLDELKQSIDRAKSSNRFPIDFGSSSQFVLYGKNFAPSLPKTPQQAAMMGPIAATAGKALQDATGFSVALGVADGVNLNIAVDFKSADSATKAVAMAKTQLTMSQGALLFMKKDDPSRAVLEKLKDIVVAAEGNRMTTSLSMDGATILAMVPGAAPPANAMASGGAGGMQNMGQGGQMGTGGPMAGGAGGPMAGGAPAGYPGAGQSGGPSTSAGVSTGGPGGPGGGTGGPNMAGYPGATGGPSTGGPSAGATNPQMEEAMRRGQAGQTGQTGQPGANNPQMEEAMRRGQAGQTGQTAQPGANNPQMQEAMRRNAQGGQAGQAGAANNPQMEEAMRRNAPGGQAGGQPNANDPRMQEQMRRQGGAAGAATGNPNNRNTSKTNRSKSSTKKSNSSSSSE